jgi:hypothetical protein
MLAISLRLFPKDNQFAEYIVENHDEHIGNQFHHETVKAHEINERDHNAEVDKVGQQPATEKLRGFFHQKPAGRGTLKYPYFIRHIRENDGQNPRNRVGGGGAEV